MMAASSLPRGIKSHNPGHLPRTTARWQGAAPALPEEPALAAFTAPEFGIRALAKTLLNFQRNDGVRRLDHLLRRLTGPGGDNHAGFCRIVAAALGRPVDAPIDLADPAVLLTLVQAVIRYQNGPPPDGRRAWYALDLVAHGVAMAVGAGAAIARRIS